MKAIYEDYKARITERLKVAQLATVESEPGPARASEASTKFTENKYLPQERLPLKSVQRSLPVIEAENVLTQNFCKIRMAVVQRYEIQLRGLEEKF